MRKKIILIIIALLIIICGILFFFMHKKNKKKEVPPAKAYFEVNGLSFDFSIESFARANEETGEVEIPTVDFPKIPIRLNLILK